MERWRLQPARDLGLPLGERLRSLKRESGLIDRTARVAWWSAVRAYFAVAHRLSVTGREHLPSEPPFVLVANHSSHLDAMLLAAALPGRLWNRVFPIAAGDTFFETPVAALFAAGLLNALPMWRRNCGSHAMRELRERLVEEPCGYILFPEGTRSLDGKMKAFKPGAFKAAQEAETEILPVVIDGTGDAVPKKSWRIKKHTRFLISIGKPVKMGPDDSVTEIQSKVHAEMAKRLSQLRKT